MKSANIEKIMKRKTIQLYIAGALLILAGASIAFKQIATTYELVGIAQLGQFGLAIEVLLLAALILAFTSLTTRKLIKAKQDEYSQHLDIKSRAIAYDVLGYGVMTVALLLGGTGLFAIGLLVMLVGITWIIVAYKGGRVNVY